MFSPSLTGTIIIAYTSFVLCTRIALRSMLRFSVCKNYVLHPEVLLLWAKKRAKVLLFFELTKKKRIFFAYMPLFLYFCRQI